MRIRTLSILLGFAACYPVVEAIARPTSYEISATVYNVGDPGNSLAGSVKPGDVITGTYSIDPETPDSNSSPEYGHYPHDTAQTDTPQVGFDLLLNGHVLKSDHTLAGHLFEAHVLNGYSDHFSINSWGNQPLANATNVDEIFLDLYDSTGRALASDALLSQAPDIGAFDFHDIHVSGSGANNAYFYIDAKINSIAAVQSQCGTASFLVVEFSLNATVRDIYDGDNVLNNAIKIGDTLSGSYAFNTSTVDSDPSVAFGHFAHLPGSGEYGFDITVNNHSIKTDSSTAQFNVFLYDG